MAILARFRVNSVEAFESGSRPKLIAVYSPEEYESPEVLEEIRSFYEATPTGTLEMFIKSDAAEQFQVGGEFYLRLEPIPVDQTTKAISQRHQEKHAQA